MLIGDIGFDTANVSPNPMPAIAMVRTHGCESYDGAKCTQCIKLPNSYEFFLDSGQCSK